jgi:hypothetical protein
MNENDKIYLINEIENMIKLRNLIVEKHNQLIEKKNEFDHKCIVYENNRDNVTNELKYDLQDMRNFKNFAASGIYKNKNAVDFKNKI